MRNPVLKISLLLLLLFSFSLFFQSGSVVDSLIYQAIAHPSGHGGPPPEALAACEVQNVGEVCSFDSPKGGVILGTCEHVRDGSLACVPEGAHPGGPGEDRPPKPE